MSEYQEQVEKKIRVVVENMEKMYKFIEKLSESQRQTEMLRMHKELFIEMNRAYMIYIGELKRMYNSKLMELPRPKDPSTRFGGNS